MRRKVIMLVVAALVVVSLLAVGCAPKPSAPATPAAPAEKVIKWVGQSHVPQANRMYGSLERTAERITAASNGRLELTLEAAGGICPATKEFDGIDSGVLDFGVTCFMYWMDKFPAAGLFTMKSGGMSPAEAIIWFREGGGGDLAQEMVKDYDVKLINGGGYMGPPELFMHTDKELKKLSDLKGLKIRAAGDGGAILSRVGAGVVFMPAGEIFESMTRGVIDAFECSNPTVDWDLGLNEVGKYVYSGGCRQPYEFNPFMVNQKSWNELPDDLKVIVEEVAGLETIRIYSQMCVWDMESLDKFRDYGCIVGQVTPEMTADWMEVANEFYAEKAAEDAFMAEVLDSYNSFQTAFDSIWAKP